MTYSPAIPEQVVSGPISIIMMSKRQSHFHDEFALEIRKGLGDQNKKQISPKYFYDSNGSKLFEEICRQPEYYPWRMEAAILRKYCQKIVDTCCNKQISIIELGCGSSTKTRILLQEVLARQPSLYYFPIDVSDSMLNEAIRTLSQEFSHLRTIGICSEYVQGLISANRFISGNNQIPDEKLIIFLGSSIGNFEPDESALFLKEIRSIMGARDMLLLGFDLRKNVRVLEEAYNDRWGITAKFNLNLLVRINRELGGEFNLDRFFHLAYYNPYRNRVEMHLVSDVDQEIYVRRLRETYNFRKNESIHTENSYKYSLSEIKQVAAGSGFSLKSNFLDEKKWFDVVLLSPV
ncbi:MAG TPA: L-histidine N(alpha)-methyltransferase [Candidatus Nitrosopolaris sp.]|nr:L-histidine N(alpha)-methyltransferase [Candidatus Nitrosopolaris sp.]